MEAASIPQAPPPPQRTVADVIRDNILWILFAAVLVLIGISDFSKHDDITPLANNIKDGLSVGTIWALIALGYTLVYGIIELINFAHGEVFMIGSFVAVSLFATFGLAEDTAIIGLILGM